MLHPTSSHHLKLSSDGAHHHIDVVRSYLFHVPHHEFEDIIHYLRSNFAHITTHPSLPHISQQEEFINNPMI